MRGQLRIDLSDNCNIRCIMCQAHNHSSPSNVSFLDFEMFKDQTAGQLGNWDTIQLGNIAEPTIHPKFADFLRYIRSQTTARIHIVTNGKLLDRFADVINECECLVQISTDSLQKETHEYLRVSSNYDNLMRNLSLLDLSRTEVLLSFTLMRSNIDEYDEILQFCSNRGYQLSIFPMTLRVGNGAMIPYNLAWESLWFCKDKLKQWLKTFYGNSYNDMLQGTASGKEPTAEWLSRFTCRAHETDLMIDGHGNTLLCSMERLPSLQEMRLDDLWRSDQAEEFRVAVANGRIPCMACDYLERCLAPSMSRMENHFDKSINTILTDATKHAIRFDSTLSDEQQISIFLKDIAQELEVYYMWEDNGHHRSIQMTNFDQLAPPDQMLQLMQQRTDKPIFTANTSWDLHKHIAPTPTSPGGQRKIKDDYHGFVLVEYKGEFWGFPTVYGLLNLNDSGSRITPGLIRAASLSELRAQIKQNPKNEPYIPILLESGVCGYNLVAYLDSYWAIPGRIGSVNLIEERTRARLDIIQTTTLEELRSKIKSISSNYRQHPELLEQNLYGFNVVGLLDRYYAIPACLGHVNLENIQERDRPEILVSRSRERLESLITKIGKKPFAFPELLENDYEGYNLVGHGDTFIAVPVHFGPMDLSETQANEQSGIYRSSTFWQTRRMASDNAWPIPPRVYHQDFNGYRLLRCNNRFFAVPNSNWPLDLTDEEACATGEVLSDQSLRQLKERIEQCLC